MEIAQIILDYLKVFISWPVAVLIIGLVFICKFGNEIKRFLEKTSELNVGPVSMRQSSQPETMNVEKVDEQISKNLEEEGIVLKPEDLDEMEADFNKLTEEKEQKEAELKDKNELLNYAIQRAETYEFAYLGKILVLNTQRVLHWFFLQGKSTKLNFFNLFQLPQEVPNHNSEKEAIFNILIANNLLEADSVSPEFFKPSTKGIRFLKFAGFIS